MRTQPAPVLALGAGIGLLIGYVAWGGAGATSPAEGPRRKPETTSGTGGVTFSAPGHPEVAPTVGGSLPSGPSAGPSTTDDALTEPPKPRRPWEVAYDGPALEYEAAVALVRQEVAEADYLALLANQYSPGLAELRPPVSERQRVEILDHLRSTAREHLLAERVEIGLRAKLTEDARIRAIRTQSRANRDAMRHIRERVLTREQEAQLPPYWRD